MDDTRVERMQDMCDALEEYQLIHGGRYLLYMLPADHPLPAPDIQDRTLASHDVMIIVPQAFYVETNPDK